MLRDRHGAINVYEDKSSPIHVVAADTPWLAAVRLQKSGISGYKLASFGTCVGTGTWIESKIICEEAAATLRLVTRGHTREPTWLYGLDRRLPYGCYYKKSEQTLHWNRAGNKMFADARVAAGGTKDDTDELSVCSRTSGGTCHLAPLLSASVSSRD